jgi:hypothetical protein
MLDQVYGTTSEMLDSLKYLQRSQGSEEVQDIPLQSGQYKVNICIKIDRDLFVTLFDINHSSILPRI